MDSSQLLSALVVCQPAGVQGDVQGLTHGIVTATGFGYEANLTHLFLAEISIF